MTITRKLMDQLQKRLDTGTVRMVDGQTMIRESMLLVAKTLQTREGREPDELDFLSALMGDCVALAEAMGGACEDAEMRLFYGERMVRQLKALSVWLARASECTRKGEPVPDPAGYGINRNALN
jgi:hypothetical protein